jgi:hypothetical protein
MTRQMDSVFAVACVLFFVLHSACHEKDAVCGVCAAARFVLLHIYFALWYVDMLIILVCGDLFCRRQVPGKFLSYTTEYKNTACVLRD